MQRILVIGFLFLFSPALLVAQSAPPFWEDIQAFKKLDSAEAPPSRPILFIGSSSFTLWKSVNADFPGYPILNRGFGGSTLVDQIRYAYDIILPYQPRQIFIYCGENDLAGGDSIPAAEAVRRFKTLFGIIRENLPGVRVEFISMKPSPSRQHLENKIRAANAAIREFLSRRRNTGYIDVYHAMLDAKGRLRKEIYLSDELHMNELGYEIWKKLIGPRLMK